MGIFWKRTALGASLFLLAGCVTAYPYQTAFETCDGQAGSCYQYCEQFSDQPAEYDACHADCEATANQCFANAYDGYHYAGPRYGYGGYDSWPWNGRYGYWRPDYGYYFNFGYYGGHHYGSPYYGGYPYGGGYNHGPHHGGGTGSGHSSGNNSSPPPQSSPPPRREPRAGRRAHRPSPRAREDRRHQKVK